jgi:hypothetical protein
VQKGKSGRFERVALSARERRNLFWIKELAEEKRLPAIPGHTVLQARRLNAVLPCSALPPSVEDRVTGSKTEEKLRPGGCANYPATRDPW